MFAGTSMKLQRGAGEGLCSSLQPLNALWKMERTNVKGAHTTSRRPEAKHPKALWGMGVGSEVCKAELLSFSHFFSLLTSTIFLWVLFTSYSASGPLKSPLLHPHFVPPYLLTPSPSFPCSSVCSSPPMFPPTCPSQLYPSPSHITLELIWHICGQVRSWQYCEVWVYHAQSGSTRDKSQGPAPGCSWRIGKGVDSSGNSETHSW